MTQGPSTGHRPEEPVGSSGSEEPRPRLAVWILVILGLIALLAVSIVRASTPSAPVAHSQDIQLVWTAPTTNTDGTALTNLAGFNLYHCLGGVCDPAVVLSVMASKYAFPPGDGLHYYSVSAFNSTGQEGPRSLVFQVVVKSVTVTALKTPGGPSGLTLR